MLRFVIRLLFLCLIEIGFYKCIKAIDFVEKDYKKKIIKLGRFKRLFYISQFKSKREYIGLISLISQVVNWLLCLFFIVVMFIDSFFIDFAILDKVVAWTMVAVDVVEIIVYWIIYPFLRTNGPEG